MKKIEQFLVKLKELLIAENAENKKMLDTYMKFAEGKVIEDKAHR